MGPPDSSGGERIVKVIDEIARALGRDSLDVWEYMDHSTKLEADELVGQVPELATVVGSHAEVAQLQ